MQQFALVHDDTQAGWQTAYYAFHFAARLGAPSHVYLVGSWEGKESEVRMAGRAAGVSLTSSRMKDFSLEVLAAAAGESDGLFLPRTLVQDQEWLRFLVTSADCPIWVVSKEFEMEALAVLVEDPEAPGAHLEYAHRLAQRTQKKLIGLVRQNEQNEVPNFGEVIWHNLSSSTPAEILAAFEQLKAGFLFIPMSRLSLVFETPINLVIFPGRNNQLESSG